MCPPMASSLILELPLKQRHLMLKINSQDRQLHIILLTDGMVDVSKDDGSESTCTVGIVKTYITGNTLM